MGLSALRLGWSRLRLDRLTSVGGGSIDSRFGGSGLGGRRLGGSGLGLGDGGRVLGRRVLTILILVILVGCVFDRGTTSRSSLVPRDAVANAVWRRQTRKAGRREAFQRLEGKDVGLGFQGALSPVWRILCILMPTHIVWYRHKIEAESETLAHELDIDKDIHEP